MIKEKICAIIPWNNPSPVGFMNVFEEGDIWVKVKGCEECPDESKAICCINCPSFTGSGCGYHEGGAYSTNKPYQCVVKPTPDQGKSHCILEYLCVKGKYKGKIRHLNKPLDELNG